MSTVSSDCSTRHERLRWWRRLWLARRAPLERPRDVERWTMVDHCSWPGSVRESRWSGFRTLVRVAREIRLVSLRHPSHRLGTSCEQLRVGRNADWNERQRQLLDVYQSKDWIRIVRHCCSIDHWRTTHDLERCCSWGFKISFVAILPGKTLIGTGVS